MSSRLKKRKVAAAKGHDKNGRSKQEILHVDTYAGSFSGSPVGKNGWMLLNGFVLNAGFKPLEAMHVASCPETGLTYIRPYSGKARTLSETQQVKLLAMLEKEVASYGGPPNAFETLPIWLRIEKIEAMLDFEKNPPCGCPPAQKSAQASSLMEELGQNSNLLQRKAM